MAGRNFKIPKKFSIAWDNYTCPYCGAIGGKLEANHIIPFSKCVICNRQKKDKTPSEYLKWKSNKS
jgi:hypothetical protein